MRVIRIMTVLAIAIFIMAAAPSSQGLVTGYKMPMIFTLVGGQATLDQISQWPDGYIQDRDVIMLTQRQFEAADHLNSINGLADNVRAKYPGVRIGVRTFGQRYMRNLKNAALSENITILSYVYEPRWDWGDEPEFSKDFTKTLANYDKLQREMSTWTNAGKEIWTEPTGQGLPHRNYEGWNYADIAQYVDVVAIQSQHNAQDELNGFPPDSFTDAVSQVRYDMTNAGVSVWYMQLSLGQEVNGIPGDLAYTELFEGPLVQSGAPGLHLWVNTNSVTTDGRTFMDLWAPER